MSEPTARGPLPEERRATFLSAAAVFLLLAGYFLVRPVRDVMGIRGGIEKLPTFFLCVLVATLLLNPLFSLAVSRWSRRRFLPWAWRSFALALLGFGVWSVLARGKEQTFVFAWVFFVWLSVMNLFVTSVFWGLMADVWSPASAKRVYGRIAIGATAGAVFGTLVGLALRQVHEVWFLPVLFGASALFVEVATRVALRISPAAPAFTPAREAPVGGDAWEGFRRLVRSPYLAGIAGYLFLHTVVNTFLYVVRAQAVQTEGIDAAGQADLFFSQELAIQSVTLAIQLRGTSRVLTTLGVAGALVAAPAIVASGSVVLVLTASLAVSLVVHGLTRVVHFALAKPGSEVLYTVVPRGEKYKSKSLIDTFVYRGGDWLGAQAAEPIRAAGAIPALGLATLPMCAAAALLGVVLARAQTRRAPLENAPSRSGPD